MIRITILAIAAVLLSGCDEFTRYEETYRACKAKEGVLKAADGESFNGYKGFACLKTVD